MRYGRSRMSKDKEDRFLALINDNNEQLYKIAYSYVKDKDDALEVVQEAIYKGYISYHRVRKPEYEKTWLIRIVINAAIDLIRKKKKVTSIDKGFIENIGDSDIGNIDERLVVEKTLKNLNESERTVIILRFFEDMPLDEIADVLNEPVSTVKSRLYRTLKKMKIDLKEVNMNEK